MKATPAQLPAIDDDWAFEVKWDGVRAIAKRLGSPYRPGRRSRDWLKVKNVRGQEVVIGGWLPGKGRRDGEIGSLLVAQVEFAEWTDAGTLRHPSYKGLRDDKPAEAVVRES